MHYVLFYDLVDDYLARRPQYREAHLKFANAAHACGELVLGGAMHDPVDCAMILFHSRESAGKFAKADPFVVNGLVKSWRIREWRTVVGDGASPP